MDVLGPHRFYGFQELCSGEPYAVSGVVDCVADVLTLGKKWVNKLSRDLRRQILEELEYSQARFCDQNQVPRVGVGVSVGERRWTPECQVIL